MQVNRKDFLTTLTTMRPGLSNKERVDQANSFVFSKGHLVTYNEYAMVIAPQELDGLEGAVRAEELLSILGKLSAETIDLSVDDGQLIIKAGRSRSGIRFEDSIRVPVDVVKAEYEAAVEMEVPAKMMPALDMARFCASHSLNDEKLTGIRVAEGCATSTDNYRILQSFFDSGELPEFLIPATCVDAALAYRPTHVAVTDTWAFFRNESGLIFCCRLIATDIDDPFPTVDHLFQIEGPQCLLPKEILGALDKADIFTKTAAHETDRFVTLTLKPGRVVVRGEGDFGWYEESVPAKEYKGEVLEFSAHPEFLRQILPIVQNATIGENIVLFEGEDFRHVFVRAKRAQQDDQGEE